MLTYRSHLSDIATKDDEDRCPGKDDRAKLVRQKINFEPGEQRDDRHGIEHQKGYPIDCLGDGAGMVRVGYSCDDDADENQSGALIDPFHGNDSFVVQRDLTKSFYNRPGWEEMGDSPDNQQHGCDG